MASVRKRLASSNEVRKTKLDKENTMKSGEGLTTLGSGPMSGSPFRVGLLQDSVLQEGAMRLLRTAARLTGQVVTYAIALAKVYHAVEAWDFATAILKRKIRIKS